MKAHKKNTRTTKDEVINVRCLATHKKMFETAAAREGLGVSTWLARLGLLAVEERATRKGTP